MKQTFTPKPATSPNSNSYGRTSAPRRLVDLKLPGLKYFPISTTTLPHYPSGNLLDTRHARVLNPRSSVAFGVQKPRPIHTGVALLGWYWLLQRPCLLLVTPDVTLETTELRFPSRIEAVGKAAAAVSEFLNRVGIGEDV